MLQVVKFWREKGKCGFLVCQFKLRRDDAAPGPWTKEGQQRMRELGVQLQEPAGNREAKEAMIAAAAAANNAKTPLKNGNEAQVGGLGFSASVG